MEIVEGHCFGGLMKDLLQRISSKKTLKQWQMSFTNTYEYTCISYIERLKELTTHDHEIHHPMN
jgi:hypothetical protein